MLTFTVAEMKKLRQEVSDQKVITDRQQARIELLEARIVALENKT